MPEAILRPVDLEGLIPKALPRPIQPMFESIALGVLAIGQLERIHRQLPHGNPAEFARAALERLGARFDVRAEEQFRIPMQGGAVVVANHPFGGLEGLFLIWLLRCLRPDVRLLANFQLSRIRELGDLFIPVDPIGGARARRENARGLRRALQWVRNGGLLVLFPAGEVSSFDWRASAVIDPPWSETAARLIRLARAPVVPIHFGGRNSVPFQLAGLLHPRLRTALLPRELLNKSRVVVPVRIGTALPFAELEAIDGDAALTAHLRMKTYRLSADSAPARRELVRPSRAQVAVAGAVEPQRLVDEVAALAPEQRLQVSGELEVYCAHAPQLPSMLQEIGRLRELTFRAVGEGTGRALDIDLFDEYYEHLFVWNRARNELVGAYRLGRADRICERYGRCGLYTSTLFEYRAPLLRRLHPALELGRSFVRVEYQKSFAALLLLWKGIGEYVARNPRYAVLFGAVSISNDYLPASQQLLVEHLRRHCFDPWLAQFVKPRRPFRGRNHLHALAGRFNPPAQIDTLSALVSGIEPDGKGVPILIRQYLKVGGRVLGFNVDSAFGESIDCLIKVDLRETEPRALAKYMGVEGAAAFQRYHASAADLTLSRNAG